MRKPWLVIATLFACAAAPAEESENNRESGEHSRPQWQTNVTYGYEWFNKGFDAWSDVQVSAQRLTPDGPVTVRFSRAAFLGQSSNQAAIDFYPRLGSGARGYLSFGYSPDASLYPQFRLAGDLYQRLGYGFEAGAGMRRLGFSMKVNSYMTSLSKRHRNWLFDGRTFFTPLPTGTSRSTIFTARRYFHDGAEYVGLRFGHGGSPLEPLTLVDLGIRNSASVYIEANKSFGRRWTINFRGGRSREDRFPGITLNRSLLEGSLYLRF